MSGDGISAAWARAVVSECEAQGVDPEALAEATGIPRATLRRRLSGAAPFLVAEAAALSDVLGVSLAEMARRAEDLMAA